MSTRPLEEIIDQLDMGKLTLGYVADGSAYAVLECGSKLATYRAVHYTLREALEGLATLDCLRPPETDVATP